MPLGGHSPILSWQITVPDALWLAGGLVVMLVAVPVAIAISWLVERWGRR